MKGNGDRVRSILLHPLILGGVWTWHKNQAEHRASEEYTRKEENYKALLRSLRGFYEVGYDPGQIQQFIDQLKLCWLYCPDEVIKRGNAFLGTAHVGSSATDEERDSALGEFVLAVRRDLLSRAVVRET